VKIAARRTRPHLSREILSRLDLVEELCLEIRAMLKEQGVVSLAFEVELLARECLNNAVKHGNRGDESKQVALTLSFLKEQIRLRVADEGEGFDWKKVLGRRLAEQGDESGRGLSIVSSYSDRFRFNRRGNQITLWLRRMNARKTN
jgi:anti-sigma regulatory factor (Ser/Thr protein kinase)